MTVFRYSRWDGTQEVFPVHEDDLMDLLSEQLMTQGDVSNALRSLTQQGVPGRYGQRLPGLQELIQRLRAARQETLNRYNLDSVVGRLRHQLNEIVQKERQGIDRRLAELRQPKAPEELPEGAGEELVKMMERLAQRNREFLDALPEDAAEKIKSLQGYEFMDSGAKAQFDDLLQSLQRQVLNSHFKALSQRMRNLGPQTTKALKEMLRELNRLLEERLQGGEPDFQQFKQRFAPFLGSLPSSSLDELVETIRQQMAQMESLLHSMTPDMRRELESILESVFSDDDLRREMAKLAENLEFLRPLEDMGREYSFFGEEPMTLQEALKAVERLQEMEELEKQLKRTQQGGNLSSVDSQLLKDLLGEESYQDVERLKHLTDILEKAGYIRRVGNRFEVTPKGIRKIGQRALQEIFAYIKRGRTGTHPSKERGMGNERTEDSKRYEFGDAFSPHLQRTLMNAIRRTRGGVPVGLETADFEVYGTEQLAQSSTVLMVDLSLSMAMRGNFVAAKKVALALDNLIRTQFPRDALYIIGFSTYAREVKADRLPYLSWDEFDPYTNIQHGLALAQKLLARVSGGSKQIIMISDGEPTAHMEGGQLFLQYPPSPRTIRETLREVKRCTHSGIVINTFMLDRNSYLVEFVEQMTRLNRGRVFFTSADRLGEYILVDYLTNRRRVVG